MLRYVLSLSFFSYWAYTLFRRFMYSMKLFLPDTHDIIHKNNPRREMLLQAISYRDIFINQNN